MNSTDPQRLVDLVGDLVTRGADHWVEFKLNNPAPDMIGVWVSAISNAARLVGQQTGFMLWGIEDASHSVVGTTFDPNTAKVGNQVFLFWLAQQLSPSITFQFQTI
jgi:predicted HTH transcriptional regulator